MDVTPAIAVASTVFLHALEISDSGKTAAPTQYVKSDDGKMDGAIFKSDEHPYLVFFSASLDPKGDTFQRVHLPVAYKVNSQGSITHVLAELESGKTVTVSVDGKRIGRYKTSKGGVLMFRDNASGARRIKIEE